MISVPEALNKIFTTDVKPAITIVKLDDSLGHALAELIVAPISLPPFKQSAMDGYAVCGIHKSYQVIGEIQAGKTEAVRLDDGTAIRIFTGGAVPDNATAVIMQEKVELQKTQIVVHDEIVDGKNIRPVGEQIAEGETVFEQGQNLNAAAIGLLASLGISKVSVFQAPSIGLVPTGNELIPAGYPLAYGQIYESNSATLNAASKSCGYSLDRYPAVTDTLESTKEILMKLLEDHDVLLISGGISVGDYDFVGKALQEIGVEEVFYKIKQKPGKPMFFGRYNGKFIFALPGNPAASLTCFYMYVLPLLDRLSGKISIGLTRSTYALAEDFKKNSGRANLLKAQVKDNKVYILEGQASSMLYSFAQANAIAYIGEETENPKKGEMVEVYMM